MEEQTLHFTLGPVQGFIAQARRTRDLWAGSFLLSYLAGHAMSAVLEAEGGRGEIVFPAITGDNNYINDSLLRAIKESRENKIPGGQPTVGSLPNRFKAKIPKGFDPNECISTVLKEWEKIAYVVWDEFISPVSEVGNETKTIWDRQVNNFWEMTWALGEDSSCLDRRKNWRTQVPPAELGDKCTIMGNMQEISGYVRAQNKKKQDLFWEKLRNKTGEIKEGERLCAVTLIKRLFPLVANKALGWDVPKSYPSTNYIASIPWILKNMKENDDTAKEFMEIARKGELKSRTYMEKYNGIDKIEQAKKEYSSAAGLAECDGNFFYESSLMNDNLWPEDTRAQREELIKKLKDFSSKPSAFYAVLVVDGDLLGALLRNAGETIVSSALTRFTEYVSETVQKYSGKLVYSGGDDVLALLPALNAVGLAAELRQNYRAAFENTGVPEYLATVSAGLVFAHYHAPLQAVMREAHSLLDDVAKHYTGRDSLAVRVWNAGGPSLTWAVPWEIALEEGPNLLDRLVNDFTGGTSGKGQYNSSFFYNLRQRFSQLLDEHEKDPELKDLNPVDLFLAEYIRSRGDDTNWEEARQRMERLVKICRKYRRVNLENESRPRVESQGISVNGAILVRFLAERGAVD